MDPVPTNPDLPQDRDNDILRLSTDQAVLANERTYQAWLRTGLASVAAGLAIFKLMQDAIPLWILLMLAIVLLGFGAVAFWLASWRYCNIHLRSSHLDVSALSPRVAKATSWVLIGVSALALFGLLLDLHAITA